MLEGGLDDAAAKKHDEDNPCSKWIYDTFRKAECLECGSRYESGKKKGNSRFWCLFIFWFIFLMLTYRLATLGGFFRAIYHYFAGSNICTISNNSFHNYVWGTELPNVLVLPPNYESPK